MNSLNDTVHNYLESQKKINETMVRSDFQTRRTLAALVGFLIDNGGITLEQAAELNRILYEEKKT